MDSHVATSLVQILDCTRETVEALAARTKDSVTAEELIYREAELGAVHCTAEISGVLGLDSPDFMADLWAAYDKLTAGNVAAGSDDLLRAARHLSGTGTGASR